MNTATPTSAFVMAINIAIGSCLICAITLFAVRVLRRKAVPLRHSLLVIAVGLTILSPLFVAASGSIGVGLFQVSVDETSNQVRPVAKGDGEPKESVARLSNASGNATVESKSQSTVEAVKTKAASHAEAVATLSLHDPQLGGSPTVAAVLEVAKEERPLTGRARSEVDASHIDTIAMTVIAIWGLGFVVCLFRLARGLWLVRRVRRSFIVTEDQRVTRAATRGFESVGLTRRDVFESDQVSVPLTLGLLRPVIVLPTGLGDSLDNDELTSVLLHEIAHIKRRDTWIGMLQRLTSVAFWWSPLLSLVNRIADRLREQICDDYVIAAQGDGRPLAKAIVKVAEWTTTSRPLPCCSTLFSDVDELSERINRLTEKEHIMTLRLTWKAMNLVVLFSIVLATVLFVPTLRIASAQDAKPTVANNAQPNPLQPLAAGVTPPRPTLQTSSDAQTYALEYATTILIFFDKDQDARLSRDEAKSAAWPYAEKVWFHGDSNNDNRVSRQELKNEFLALWQRIAKAKHKHTHQFAEENWKKVDTNKDGLIDRDEARKSYWLPAEQVWFRGDLDKDDKLTVNEMRIHYAVGALDKSIRMKAAVLKKHSPASGNKKKSAGEPSALATRYAQALLKRFDHNRNGSIGRDESRTAPWPKSETVWFGGDSNRDNRVTADELEAQYTALQVRLRKSKQQEIGNHSTWLMRVVDRNKDGAIDRQETQLTSWPKAGNNWFKGDANGDDKVTYDELVVAMAMSAQDKGARLAEAAGK